MEARPSEPCPGFQLLCCPRSLHSPLSIGESPVSTSVGDPLLESSSRTASALGSSSPLLGLRFVVEVGSLLTVVPALLEAERRPTACTGLVELRADVVALLECTADVEVHTP